MGRQREMGGAVWEEKQAGERGIGMQTELGEGRKYGRRKGKKRGENGDALEAGAKPPEGRGLGVQLEEKDVKTQRPKRLGTARRGWGLHKSAAAQHPSRL